MVVGTELVVVDADSSEQILQAALSSRLRTVEVVPLSLDPVIEVPWVDVVPVPQAGHVNRSVLVAHVFRFEQTGVVVGPDVLDCLDQARVIQLGRFKCAAVMDRMGHVTTFLKVGPENEDVDERLEHFNVDRDVTQTYERVNWSGTLVRLVEQNVVR